MTWDVFAELQEIEPAVREENGWPRDGWHEVVQTECSSGQATVLIPDPPLKEGEEPGLWAIKLGLDRHFLFSREEDWISLHRILAVGHLPLGLRRRRHASSSTGQQRARPGSRWRSSRLLLTGFFMECYQSIVGPIRGHLPFREQRHDPHLQQ